MLVMRRRVGERLIIGPDVELEILEISPTRVKLGINAPQSVAIVRKEVAATRDENLKASQAAPLATIERLSQRLSRRQPKP